MFLTKTNVKIVATILVKDEADIIGANIEHHIEQGVSQFIVTNNRSTDDTRSIVERYPEVVEIIDEEDETHHQSKWVTRMARLACKLKPDWIVHLDADELWGGLGQLRHIRTEAAGSERMLFHFPAPTFTLYTMRHFLRPILGLPEERKVAHRPNPDIEITHGNHGFTAPASITPTPDIYRHHYPIRSYEQFARKAIDGHKALSKRGAPCARWERWCELWENGQLESHYGDLVECSHKLVEQPCKEHVLPLLRTWSTDEVVKYVEENNPRISVGRWPL